MYPFQYISVSRVVSGCLSGFCGFFVFRLDAPIGAVLNKHDLSAMFLNKEKSNFTHIKVPSVWLFVYVSPISLILPALQCCFALLRINTTKKTRFTFPAHVARLSPFSVRLKKLVSETCVGGSVESLGPPDVWTQLSPVTLVTTGRHSVTAACPPLQGSIAVKRAVE